MAYPESVAAFAYILSHDTVSGRIDLSKWNVDHGNPDEAFAYRYVAALARDAAGPHLAAALEEEERMIAAGGIRAIGRRFVAWEPR